VLFLHFRAFRWFNGSKKPADRIDPPMVRAGTVEAQEFILKDETGHICARLSPQTYRSNCEQPMAALFIGPKSGIPGQAALSSTTTRAMCCGPCRQ